VTANKSFHQFDNGFVPTANRAYDSIAVSPQLAAHLPVSRKGPGEYSIRVGSFIAGVAAAVTLQLRRLPSI